MKERRPRPQRRCPVAFKLVARENYRHTEIDVGNRGAIAHLEIVPIKIIIERTVGAIKPFTEIDRDLQEVIVLTSLKCHQTVPFANGVTDCYWTITGTQG